MSGYTPGPWEACEPGDYGDFDGDSRVVCGDDMRIAVVHWHPRLNTEMSDANARLIAAAPELLEALQNIFMAECRVWDDELQTDVCVSMDADEMRDIAEAAIQKATS